MPVCTVCGQEVSFVPQYQQWYCQRCGIYPYLQQAAPSPYYAPQAAYPMPYYYQQPYYYQPAVQPQFSVPPAVPPNPVAARSKINASFMSRQSTDAFIPTSWAWVILLFQIVFPASAVVAVLLIAQNASITVNDGGVLISLVLSVLLISIALAVTHAVLVHKLVRRRDEHFRRDALLNEGMTEYLGAVAMNTNIDLNVERWTMNSIRLTSQPQERSPMLWAMLVGLIAIIPIVGVIFLIYSQMFLTKDVQEHDEKQRSLNYQFMCGMMKAGKMKQTDSRWQPLPKRDTAAYVVLTLLTLGLFLPYWWYVNIADMNTHMKNQWEFENALAESIRAEG